MITLMIFAFMFIILLIVGIPYGLYAIVVKDFIDKRHKVKREKLMYEMYREMLPSLEKMVEN